MAKKKKTITKQDQKHLAAQYRADFFRKMKYVIDNVCGEGIFQLIPKEVFDNVYLSRYTPFNIMADYNSNIPSKSLKICKSAIPQLLKSEIISFLPSKIEISLYDIYTVVFTIAALKIYVDHATFDQKDKVLSALKILLDYFATYENVDQQMYYTLHSSNTCLSDLSHTLYWFKHDVINPTTLPAESENIIRLYSVTPEKIQVSLSEGTRPAIRVGWAMAYTGPEWSSIKPSALGFNTTHAETPLKVYIQSHALNRLQERIDCFIPGAIHYNMYLSLQNPIIAYDNNHRLLIEYTFFSSRAGYFRADMVDGIILLRTFLFVTNSGTPEGQLLEKNTGLKKLDKKYLAIDKLSTFMNSDLDKNLEAQRLFKESNCECLIDLYNNTEHLLTKKDNDFHFSLMLSYINRDKADTFTFGAKTAMQLDSK
jgi:hypothetical protein